MTWLFETIMENYFYIGIVIALAVWLFSIFDEVRAGQPDIDITEGIPFSIAIALFWIFGIILLIGSAILELINDELNKLSKVNRSG